MDAQTYQIIGAALEVRKELGCGFLEPVYREALELEFGDRGIPFRPQAATCFGQQWQNRRASVSR